MKPFVFLSVVDATILATVFLEQLELHSTTLPALRIPGLVPTFFDDFSGPPNTLPSRSNWILDLGTSYPGGAPLWGNNEHETYTDSLSNIHITRNHSLVIIPRLLENDIWTSARIETQESFSCATEGLLLVEARIKLGDAPREHQQGIWPAFWALGTSFRGNYTNWPLATEWDIMEVINGGDLMYFTAHCGYAPGGPCNEYTGLGSGGITFTRGVWHTISFVVDRTAAAGNGNLTWQQESINWYLDGKKIFGVTGETVGDEATWDLLAHEEHFLLLNVAVGGNWPGPPDNKTTNGRNVAMEVDYVGVWNSL